MLGRREFLGAAAVAALPGAASGLRIGTMDGVFRMQGKPESVALAKKVGLACMQVTLGRSQDGLARYERETIARADHQTGESTVRAEKKSPWPDVSAGGQRPHDFRPDAAQSRLKRSDKQGPARHDAGGHVTCDQIPNRLWLPRRPHGGRSYRPVGQAAIQYPEQRQSRRRIACEDGCAGCQVGLVRD